jgi:hypothetical protein
VSKGSACAAKPVVWIGKAAQGKQNHGNWATRAGKPCRADPEVGFPSALDRPVEPVDLALPREAVTQPRRREIGQAKGFVQLMHHQDTTVLARALCPLCGQA